MDEFPSRTVRFRVSDVVHPRPVQVLTELFHQLSLEGQVVASTTDGATTYLVVRVPGLAEALIVPTEKASDFFVDDGAVLTASSL